MRGRRLWFSLAALFGVAALVILGALLYPSDRTPKGAYYRIVTAVNRGNVEGLFPYLETRAQHAAFTIRRYAVQSRDLVAAHFPEPRRSSELSRLEPLATAEAGPGVFALYAKQHGWVSRLRRDLSGVAELDVRGDRATIQTVRGTRYAFRRRENGIWGLTLFTAQLVADAQKAARDHALIEAAANDYRAAFGSSELEARPVRSAAPVDSSRQ